MDKELSKTLYEVENPVYMTFDDMKKKYIDKMVIITNKEGSGREGIRGGIVRYYGRASDDFYEKWGECVKIPEYDPVLLWSFAVNVNLLCGFPII
jgi:hypothetical protein